MTAGVFTNVEDRPVAVQVFALLALAGWIATALIFMWAVGGGLKEHPGQNLGDDQFVAAVLDNARNEVKTINGTILAGWIAAIVASGLTVLTFLLAFAVNPTNGAKPATVRLTDSGQTTVAGFCPLLEGKRLISGRVKPTTLPADSVQITIPEAMCRKGGRKSVRVTLRLAKSHVDAIETLATKPKPTPRRPA